MPLGTIKFAPGVNKEITPAQGMAQIVASQLIRFKFAGGEVLPEKLGGWTRYYPASVGSPIRAVWAWEGISNDIYLAAGAETSVTVFRDGETADVTPRTLTTNAAPSFSTINTSTTVTIDDTIIMSPYNSIFIETQVSIGGIILFGSYALNSVIDNDTYTILSAIAATAAAGPAGVVPEFVTALDSSIVTVNLPDHGYAKYDIFPVLVLTTVGGISFVGAYQVSRVVSSSQFEIVASHQASSNDAGYMNGGDARITYSIALPPEGGSGGYGGGGYGSGGYGTGSSSSTYTIGDPIVAGNWSVDNWGAYGIFCPAGGPIYYYSPYSGIEQAIRITEAPVINGGCFVSQAQQILIAWGSSSTPGIQDPLNVNWSDISDFENWAVTSQTQAGGRRLSSGSRIVGGAAGPSFNILWTDINVWSMDYIGPTPVYGFNVLGSNCGLIAQHAYAILNGIIYWMGNNQFFALNGETVSTIPCTVWDFVFQNLDLNHVDKVTAASNSLFNEVAFYFPSTSGGLGENDSYVKFNVVTQVWDYGLLDRTAWVDQSPAGRPIGATSTGLLFQHETSPNADGQPLVSWFETGYYEIADGEELTTIDWIIPDFTYSREDQIQSATVQMTLKFTDYPGDDAAVKERGPYSVTKTTRFVNTRLRGRYVSAKFLSDDLGSFWRMGAVKYRSVGDGRR